MSTRLSALAGLLAFVGVHAAQADGALATGPNQAHGFSYNYQSGREARQRALAECGYGCSIVTTFRQSCVAYAFDRTRGSTAFGWADDRNARRAQGAALQNCANYGGRRCEVEVRCED